MRRSALVQTSCLVWAQFSKLKYSSPSGLLISQNGLLNIEQLASTHRQILNLTISDPCFKRLAALSKRFKTLSI